MRKRKYQIGGMETSKKASAKSLDYPKSDPKVLNIPTGKTFKGFQVGGINPWEFNPQLPDKNIYDNGQFQHIDPSQYAGAGQSPDLTMPNYFPDPENKQNNGNLWKGIDYAAQGLTAILGGIQNGRIRKDERQQYLQSIQQKSYYNSGEGYNNTAAYFQKGGQHLTIPMQVLTGIPRNILNDGCYQLPKYQVGGGRQPIVVNNPNDPRLRAYQDSLTSHNNGQYNWDLAVNTADSIWNESSGRTVFNDKKNTPYIPIKTDIKPIGARYTTTGISNGKGYDNNMKFPLYKKPVQPVVYQKPQQSQGTDINGMTINIPAVKDRKIGSITPSNIYQLPTKGQRVYYPPVMEGMFATGDEGQMIGALGEDDTFYPDYNNEAKRAHQTPLNMDYIKRLLKQQGINNPKIAPNPADTIASKMKNGGKSYNIGDTMDLSPDAISQLRSQGYDFEIID